MNMPFSSLNSHGRALAAALALVIIGAGTWWAITSARSEDAIRVPTRVCKDRISGREIAPLLPTKGDEIEEEEVGFTITGPGGSCQLKVGDQDALVVYSHGTEKSSRERIQSKGIPASLGDAYGYLSDEGEISLSISCASSAPVGDKDRLVVGTYASVVQSNVRASGEPNKSTKGLRALSAFTAQAARDLAQDWFKCPGADRLPDGPVTIHWER
ncbi:hypothetical protein [Streptomyces coffeae]|uniref:Serine/threonine protein kinase n=1 Tax=Streptomyces coffeae TaxID=621382 RepID=A0ABS1N730_9ACTN|nr:hypothetical protein [Streptomyces coffeae]MBL1095739.1 hypothetical protein [Streptomyces coffeae]